MKNPEAPYIHPVHAIFPFADLLRPDVSLARFFELVDSIDPIDRDALIGLPSDALHVTVDDVDDDDAVQASRYRNFRQACEKIDAMDHVILRGVVQEIMNVHQRWADAAAHDRSVSLLKGFVDFSLTRGATPEEVRQWEIMAESKEVGRRSDLQVARRRYDLFCNSVVGPLIGFPG